MSIQLLYGWTLKCWKSPRAKRSVSGGSPRDIRSWDSQSTLDVWPVHCHHLSSLGSCAQTTASEHLCYLSIQRWVQILWHGWVGLIRHCFSKYSLFRSENTRHKSEKCTRWAVRKILKIKLRWDSHRIIYNDMRVVNLWHVKNDNLHREDGNLSHEACAVRIRSIMVN